MNMKVRSNVLSSSTPSTSLHDIVNCTSSVVSLKRRNTILLWIQLDLGLDVQMFLHQVGSVQLGDFESKARRNKVNQSYMGNDDIDQDTPYYGNNKRLRDRLKKHVHMETNFPQNQHVPMRLSYLGRLTLSSSGGESYSTLDEKVLTLEERLEDPWYNGTFLSELVAKVSSLHHRNFVKQVEQYDRLGKPLAPPKLAVVGTELTVRRKAQAIHNFYISMKVLEQIRGFPRINYAAEDIFYGQESLWDIVNKTYSCFSNNENMNRSSQDIQTQLGSRSRSVVTKRTNNSSNLNENNNQSLVVKPQSHPNKLQTRSKSAPPLSTEQSITKSPRSLRSILRNKSSFEPIEANEHKSEEKNKSKLNSVNNTSKQSNKQSIAHVHFKNINSSPSNSSKPPFVSSTNGSDTKSLVLIKPNHDRTSSPLTISRVRKLEMDRERNIARAKDRKQRSKIVDGSEKEKNEINSSPSSSQINKKVVSKYIDGDATSTNSNTNQKRRREIFRNRLAKASHWTPPVINEMELASLRENTDLPIITTAQQVAVKEWLVSLHLSIIDGEGGFLSPQDMSDTSTNPTALSPPPLSLSKDRLRNGELLCDLIFLLETDTAVHANLSKLIHREPRTFSKCLENIERALWLIKIRKSPPIPALLLSQPHEIIKGDKSILWGLLWEMMQAYSQSTNITFENNDNKRSNPSIQSEVYRKLPYSPSQRRLLDISLLNWLYSNPTKLLKDILGDMPLPPTIIALESYCKDGTLLCLILERILCLDDIRFNGWNKKPHTYAQCLSNVSKCVNALKACSRMSTRFLYHGIEEEIVRGSWDSILGLLEDIHRYADIIDDKKEANESGYNDPKLRFRPDALIKELNTNKVSHFRVRKQSPSFPNNSNNNSNNSNNPYLGNKIHRSSGKPLLFNYRYSQVGLEKYDGMDEEKEIAVNELTNNNNNFNNINEFAPKLNIFSSLESFNHNNNNNNNMKDVNNNDIIPSAFSNNRFYNNNDTLTANIPNDHFMIHNNNNNNNNNNNVDNADVKSFLTKLAHRSKGVSYDFVGRRIADEMDGSGSNHPSKGFHNNNNNNNNIFSTHKNRLEEKDDEVEDDLNDSLANDSNDNNNYINNNSNSSSNDNNRHRDMLSNALSIDSNSDDDEVTATLHNQYYNDDNNNHITNTRLTPRSSNKINNNNNNNKQLPRSAAKNRLINQLAHHYNVNDNPNNNNNNNNNPTVYDQNIEVDRSQLKSIIQWIEELGVKIWHHNYMLLSELEFSDGVILSRVVQKLERISPLPGFNASPTTTAQKIVNIRRSLEYIADKNRKIPLRILSCEEDILSGNLVTTLALFSMIKKAYTLHIR
eukprot:gene4370-6182_t